MSAIRLGLFIALPCLLAAPALADGGPTWNRRVEALSVLPSAGGGHQIGAYISVQADPTSAPLSLDTEVDLLINGTTVASELFEISSQAEEAGPCGPCGDPFDICTCGFDPATGVFGCHCGPFLTWFNTQATVQPEDEIMILLRPAPGALPESQEGDDVLLREYRGHPIFWNRRIASIEVVPSSGPASASFDVFFEVDVEASYSGPLSLLFQPQLLVNGVPWDGTPVCPGGCGDTLVWNPCAPDGQCPGLCAMNATGQFVGECSGSCSPQMPPCNCCVSGYVEATFVGVPAEPGDVMVVILKPVPGALPELPGFPDDEEMVPVPCVGDLDGNGFVDVDDLVTVILDFDCVDPPGPCAGDVNGDGVVDVDDLVLIILNWGACFPM